MFSHRQDLHEIPNVALCFSEFNFIHSFPDVPLYEGLSRPHAGKLRETFSARGLQGAEKKLYLREVSLEDLLDGSRVGQGRCCL